MLNSLGKLEKLLLIAVILVAVFFRFWQVRDYVVFLGDEGRDMLVMRHIFTEKKLPFLGPTASVGGFYLGPIYYWMAAPFLLLWRFDPVGPSYMVAAFGLATILLLYKFLKDTVGFWPAVLTSLLYSTAPLIVRYSRSSWNPNPLPFFALLLIYFLYLGIKHKKLIYFFLAGASFGVAVQLHYLATILMVLSALIILVNTNFKKWLPILLVYVGGFMVTFSPFLSFEIRHNFPNFRTILEFVTRGTTLGFKKFNLVWLVSNTGNILIEELTRIKATILTPITFWILSIGGIFGLFKYWKDPDKKLIFSIGLIWFLGGIIGLRFYTGQIFDYYFEFMFPAPFLLAGLVFSVFWQKLILRFFSITLVLVTVGYFLMNGFYRIPPNRLVDQTAHVVDFVIEKSDNKPFNFALISENNSDHAYRYFLEIKGHKPTELETLITNQLLIVCESKVCAPLGHPIWEI
ncbi:glycosyltransferase family 39 protein, partial [Candidatus Curtissbacteria bacterium]|nr:glycosyltransferase family 39 protein [Candidatus Curtissbacteria bacterium]